MSGSRVAVVTGGSRGIGRGIVRELAKLGFAIGINYRSDASAAASARDEAIELGATKVALLKADISDIEESQALVESAVAELGPLDLWVNNAGIAPDVRLDMLETTAASWDRVLATNLRGPFFLTRAVAQSMIKRKEGDDAADPQIVFITSVSSVMASVARGEYCVAKAGLSMVARLFAVRLAEHGVRVHEIRPGIIATEMTGSVKELYDRRIAAGLSPIRRWGTPEDVGRAVSAIASGAFPFSTGTVFDIDGGLQLPRL